jgi:hypothetical protein
MKQEKLDTSNSAIIPPTKHADRRRNCRATKPMPVRIRFAGTVAHEEIRPTLNVSRDGIYFSTSAKHYEHGMPLRVSFLQGPQEPCRSDYAGEVVRIEQFSHDCVGIAVRLFLD